MMLAWANAMIFPLLARICLVILFPFSGLDKVLHWDDALKQARSFPLPGIRSLVVLSIIVEFAAPACIIIGWHDRIAAFFLAGFCVVTAILYHQFWAFPDFWAAGDSVARNHFWDFLKNFGLVGGLLLVIAHGSLLPVSVVLHHPFSSTAITAP